MKEAHAPESMSARIAMGGKGGCRSWTKRVKWGEEGGMGNGT